MPTPMRYRGRAFREVRDRAGHDVVHDLRRFADAQPADRVRLEADLDGLPRALLPQVGVNATLHDAELRLSGVGRATPSPWPSRIV